MQEPQLRLMPRTITRTLASAAVLLVLLSVAGQLYLYLTPRESPWGIVGLFNVDFEMNIPTFFSVLMLLLAALLLGITAILKRQARAPYVFHWNLLALGIFFIGMDEFTALHEKLSEPLRRLLAWETMGVFHFAWVIPGILLVLVLAVLYYRFVMDLEREMRLRFLLAGFLYLGGAIGLELIGGRYAEAHGSWNLMYSMITTVEESLEMAGLILLVDATLRYLAKEYGAVRLIFTEAKNHREQEDA